MENIKSPGYWDHFVNPDIPWYRRAIAGALLPIAAPLSLIGSLTGCNSPETFPNDVIPPHNPPDKPDTTLPDVPLNRFNTCYPANYSLGILLRGSNIQYGGAPTDVPLASVPFGGVYLAVNSGSLSLLAGHPQEATGTDAFDADAQWGSAPAEFKTQNPGDPGFGVMAVNAGHRFNGDSIATFGKPGINPWAKAFPDPQDVGFIYRMEDAVFDPDNDCRLTVRLRGAVRRPSTGLSEALPIIAVPFYSPRPDGLTDIASADFGNERLVVLNGALDMVFTFESAPGETGATSNVSTVCDGDCDTISNSDVDLVEAELIVVPFKSNDGSGGAGGGSSDGGAGGSGG